jgi:hypothetical protein
MPSEWNKEFYNLDNIHKGSGVSVELKAKAIEQLINELIEIEKAI